MTYSINLSKVAQALDNPISMRLNSNKPLDVANVVANDIIQPSHFPWSTAMVVVKKPTGIRICLDYRKLNEVSQRLIPTAQN
jgi:hypothetical protein